MNARRAPHRREVDGLRAVAIVPVVLYHAGIPGFAGGFAGVDVFFVISGYLITRILIADLAAGGIRFARFYERRARRIVPALLPVLAVTAFAAWAVMTAEDFRHFGRSLGAAGAFASNFWYALRSSYFLPAAAERPLLHTWSLGVEEQFYLLFPLGLALCWRLGRRSLLPIILVVAAASFALALWLAPRQDAWAFFLLPTRLWELLAGAGCALVPARRIPALGLAGIAMLAAGFLLIGEDTAVPGPMMLLPVVGTTLVLLFALPGTMPARLLGFAPLVGLGLISYGVYLWHLPILAILQYLWFGPLPGWWLAAATAASGVLGWASWRWIEQPIRQRRRFAQRGSLAMLCVGGLAVFLALGLAIAGERIRPRGAAAETRMDGRFAGEGIPELVLPPGSGPLPFVLYGDSHARQYFRPLAERFGAGALVSADGCLALPGVSNVARGTPDPDRCAQHFDELAKVLSARPVDTVILAAFWDRALWDETGAVTAARPGAGGDAVLIRALSAALARIPARTRVVVIGHVPGARPARAPAMHWGWLRCRTFLNGECPTSIQRAEGEGVAVNRMLARFAAGNPRVIYLDPADVLCRGADCPIVERGRLVYSDESHVALPAGRRIAARIDALLAQRPPLAIAPAAP